MNNENPAGFPDFGGRLPAPTEAEKAELRRRSGLPSEPEDHPDGPMAEHSHDLTKQQIETLEAPTRLVIEEGEEWALDPSGLLALDIDVSRQDCPVVLRMHPTLRALLDSLRN